jgi:2-iminobutanoate/2-iminopropanoate deaminase
MGVEFATEGDLAGALGHAQSATVTSPLVFAAGVAPVTVDGATEAPGDVVGQVRAALANLDRILTEAGSSNASIAKLTVYVAEHLQVDLEVAADAVSAALQPTPPLAVVGVTRLRRDDQVIELEAVAAR